LLLLLLVLVIFLYALPIKLRFFFNTRCGRPVVGSISSTEIIDDASLPTSEAASPPPPPPPLSVSDRSVVSPPLLSFPGRCNPHHAKSLSSMMMMMIRVVLFVRSFFVQYKKTLFIAQVFLGVDFF